MARNPYLFVVGCPRSGTTLLQRMLDAHPLLAVSNDPHFIPFAPGVRDGRDPPVTPELVDWLLGYRTFGRLGLGEQHVRAAAADASTYRQFVAALYDAFGAERGKPLAGEKTPRYVRYLPLLHALFPGARIVHLLRDGRDVTLSTLEWARPDRGPGRFRLWSEHPVAVCALSWRWHVTTGRRDGAGLGGLYAEVRYEELVTAPEPALRRIADHLDLPFSDRMLSFHVGRERDDPGLSAKDAWRPPTPGLRDWRTELAPDDLELFEALAGDLLSRLGYERAFPAVSPPVEALASRYRAAWDAELRERGKLAGRFDPAPVIDH
ncbi:MAG: sulfotransferase family protein [Solirubrobacteraceae bacterium]